MIMAEALYRHFSKDGELLYIGITSRIPTRLKEHSKHSHWWDQIETVKIEHYPCRESVLKAETDAIISENPKFNVRHNRGKTANAVMSATGEVAGENVTARIVALHPLYTEQEAAIALGVSSIALRRFVSDHGLAYIDLPSPKGAKIVRYISGWAIIDWLERMGAKP